MFKKIFSLLLNIFTLLAVVFLNSSFFPLSKDKIKEVERKEIPNPKSSARIESQNQQKNKSPYLISSYYKLSEENNGFNDSQNYPKEQKYQLPFLTITDTSGSMSAVSSSGSSLSQKIKVLPMAVEVDCIANQIENIRIKNLCRSDEYIQKFIKETGKDLKKSEEIKSS